MKQGILWLSLLALSASFGPVCASAQEPRRGEDVIRAMHAKYAATWYRTLSFTQRTTRHRSDGSESVETWREWAAVPGRLRIEMGEGAQGRGVIFANDSVYAVEGGRTVHRAAERNNILVLAFDVYVQDPGRSVEVLRQEGFALDQVRSDTWEGRPVYVVGAPAGDTRSPQFWIDRERLVVVRLIETEERAPAGVVEIRFHDYQRLGGGWISPRLDILSGERLIMQEEYSELRADEQLPDSLFDPDRWSEHVHG